MKQYYLKIEDLDLTITFTPKDGCIFPGKCELKEGVISSIGSIGSSFICDKCMNWNGIDIPLHLTKFRHENVENVTFENPL